MLAAIRIDETGQIFTGSYHGQCFTAARDSGADRTTTLKALQGFITSSARFVDRYEAMTIARAAGQIKGICHLNEEELDSSDCRKCNCSRCEKVRENKEC